MYSPHIHTWMFFYWERKKRAGSRLRMFFWRTPSASTDLYTEKCQSMISYRQPTLLALTHRGDIGELWVRESGKEWVSEWERERERQTDRQREREREREVRKLREIENSHVIKMKEQCKEKEGNLEKEKKKELIKTDKSMCEERMKKHAGMLGEQCESSSPGPWLVKTDWIEWFFHIMTHHTGLQSCSILLFHSACLTGHHTMWLSNLFLVEQTHEWINM